MKVLWLCSHAAASPYKEVQRYKAVRCQYLIMLRIAMASVPVFIHHTGEARPAVILPKYF